MFLCVFLICFKAAIWVNVYYNTYDLVQFLYTTEYKEVLIKLDIAIMDACFYDKPSCCTLHAIFRLSTNMGIGMYYGDGPKILFEQELHRSD